MSYLRERIKKSIEEAIDCYDWETAFEEAIADLDISEKVTECLDDFMKDIDITYYVEDKIEAMITDEIQNLNIDDMIIEALEDLI